MGALKIFLKSNNLCTKKSDVPTIFLKSRFFLKSSFLKSRFHCTNIKSRSNNPRSLPRFEFFCFAVEIWLVAKESCFYYLLRFSTKVLSEKWFLSTRYLFTGYYCWDRLRNFLHELFCQFINWTNWVNSGKFMDNCWITCQVMADMKKVYNDLIIINLYVYSIQHILLRTITLATIPIT